MKSAIRFVCLFAIIAMAAAFAACGGNSNDDGSPTPTPTGSSSPTATPGDSGSPTPIDTPESLPPLTPFSPALSERLHGIRDKVAEIRGLPVPELKAEGVATPEDVLQNNLDSFSDITEEDQLDTDAYFNALKILQLVPEDYSLDTYASDYSTGIAGFYSTENDTLVLIGTPDEEISAYDEMILAHEYTHALQDAAFDLDSLFDVYSDHPDDEAGITSYAETLSCVIEGDASFTEYTYMEEVYGPNWQNEIVYEYPENVGDGEGFPEFLSRAFGFNYNECYYFIAQLYEDGGWAAINDAYIDPPATTEQVLHIDKYYDSELATGGLPADLTENVLPGWTTTDIGQFGAFDTLNYILTITGDYFSAADAADGWGSGWGRMYTSTSHSNVLQLQLTFDTKDDLSDFVKAFGAVLREYGVDTGAIGSTGVRHFTIPGGKYYFGALGTPQGKTNAIEVLLATDAITLAQADTTLE